MSTLCQDDNGDGRTASRISLLLFLEALRREGQTFDVITELTLHFIYWVSNKVTQISFFSPIKFLKCYYVIISFTFKYRATL